MRDFFSFLAGKEGGGGGGRIFPAGYGALTRNPNYQDVHEYDFNALIREEKKIAPCIY